MTAPALRARTRVGLGLLVLLLACAESNEPQGPEDAATAFDAGRDAGRDAGKDGAVVPPRRDDECEVIGDCGPNADFVAVRADAAEEAYERMQARCSGAYDGPMFVARCESGMCTREERTDTCCGCVPPDAGDDDAGR